MQDKHSQGKHSQSKHLQGKYLTELYQLENYNDTFALGHYARVLDAIDRRTGQWVAFKVLRAEHMRASGDPSVEFRAFPLEAELLMKMSGSRHVVKLLDCGYLTSHDDRPVDGEVISYQADTLGFIRDANVYAERGWRPYLTLENLPRSQNLLYLMQTNIAGVRWRLPTEEGLDLALQFAEVLKLAHQQRVVYLDHKLEHVYWDGHTLRVIDWNSSRIVEGTSAETAQMFQKDVHNMTVGVLYPVFTGVSAQQGTLTPQPASPNDLEHRYADVRVLDFGMEPTLSKPLQDLLQAGAAQAIASIEQFTEQASEVARRMGWDFPHRPTDEALRQARTQTRDGLRKLRAGQDAVREARDLLREAIILDGINADQEQELRRLLNAINEMLARRVIP